MLLSIYNNTLILILQAKSFTNAKNQYSKCPLLPKLHLSTSLDGVNQLLCYHLTRVDEAYTWMCSSSITVFLKYQNDFNNVHFFWF